MADRDGAAETDPGIEPEIRHFLGEPTRDPELWARLWTADLRFPVQSRRGGLLGRLVVFLKRLLRPFVRAPLGDELERQRVFNLILLEMLVKQREEYRDRLREHQGALERLDHRTIQGLQDVTRHNDALFARVDQKLDRYRREAKDLWHRLGALLATTDDAVRTASSSAPAQAPDGDPDDGVGDAVAGLRRARELLREQGYVELEARHRGSEEEIARRVSAHLPRLERAANGREILDLGCGRGEALRVFGEHGLAARGVDASSEMVAHCREQGLRAEEGDLFARLAAEEEGGLGAVVSFHVIEHLPPETLPRLCRLAWRALAPGGVLILETPSPLSLVTSARNFWIDPTHLRPVHPAHLEISFREAGFEPVSRVDLHPFGDEERLPEIDLEELPEEQRELAHQVNGLRDLLDELLFGHRDFALVGVKPGADTAT